MCNSRRRRPKKNHFRGSRTLEAESETPARAGERPPLCARFTVFCRGRAAGLSETGRIGPFRGVRAVLRLRQRLRARRAAPHFHYTPTNFCGKVRVFGVAAAPLTGSGGSGGRLSGTVELGRAAGRLQGGRSVPATPASPTAQLGGRSRPAEPNPTEATARTVRPQPPPCPSPLPIQTQHRPGAGPASPAPAEPPAHSPQAAPSATAPAAPKRPPPPQPPQPHKRPPPPQPPQLPAPTGLWPAERLGPILPWPATRRRRALGSPRYASAEALGGLGSRPLFGMRAAGRRHRQSQPVRAGSPLLYPLRNLRRSIKV